MNIEITLSYVTAHLNGLAFRPAIPVDGARSRSLGGEGHHIVGAVYSAPPFF